MEHEKESKKESMLGSMPPKTAYVFGVLSATSVLAVIAVAILLPVALSGQGGGKVAGAQVNANVAAAPSTNTPTSTADISKVDVTNNPYFGDKNAPVTVAFWTDYQCPFCKRFDEQTLPTLIQQYVDKGEVKIVVKDFAFLGPDSDTAALAARAVWEVSPKNFLAWHEAMYDKQDAENGGWGNKDDVLALTKTISGIDANKVAKLMDSKKDEYTKLIAADKSEASTMGVDGTPGFVIGKQLIAGAQPTATFTQAIDALLAGK